MWGAWCLPIFSHGETEHGPVHSQGIPQLPNLQLTASYVILGKHQNCNVSADNK